MAVTKAGTRRLLVITNALPNPSSSSGELRLVRLCRLLGQHQEVSVAAISRLSSADAAEQAGGLRRLGLAVPPSGSLVQLRKTLVTHRYDGILFEYWHVARRSLPAVRRWQPWATTVIDTVDLEFVREGRAAPYSYGPPPEQSAWRRAAELSTYQATDGLVFVTVGEEAACRRLLCPPPRSWVIPNIVDARARPPGRRAPIVLFVGNFWHAPNVDGIVWFTREVWPGVRRSVAGARLRIVGAHLWTDVAALDNQDGVDVVGYMEDLTGVYDEAAVVVAPLRYGAGMKGKVTEALAGGVPVVTTTVGAEGLRVIPGRDLLVADSSDEMTGAITALLADQERAQRLGRHGQTAISAQCSVGAVVPAIEDLVDFLARPLHRRPLGWRAAAVLAESAGLTRAAAKLARHAARDRL